MVLSKKRVLFPVMGPAAPSITHYSACILGSPNPPQSTPKVSVTAPHHVTPASTGRSTKQLRQTLNGRASGPRLQRPGIPVPQKQLRERVPPQSCTRSCGWGTSGACGSRVWPTTPGRRGSETTGRDPSKTCRPPLTTRWAPAARPRADADAGRSLSSLKAIAPPSAAGSRTRRTRARRGPRLSAARCHDVTAEVFAAPVEKKITFLGWIEDWARLYRRDDA